MEWSIVLTHVDDIIIIRDTVSKIDGLICSLCGGDENFTFTYGGSNNIHPWVDMKETADG